MNKKSALQLSMNVVVIILIAIVVLVLALGFVRMLFGAATTKIVTLIEQEPEPPIPTASNVITLSRSMTITAIRKVEVIKIAVYNPTNADWISVSPDISCLTPVVDGSFKTNPKTIEQGGYEKFNILFTIRSDIPAGSHLCGVRINNTYSKDFVISVKSGAMGGGSQQQTTTSQTICQNAQDNDLCGGLDLLFGSGYKAECCIEHSLCCS